MSGNAQATPLLRSLNQLAEQRAKNAIDLLGSALPAEVVSRDGTKVTVKFALSNIPFTLPNVTIMLLGSEYIRLPVKAGCKGVVFAFDASLGAITGLGSSTVNLTQPGNLTALAFYPIGNTGFHAQEAADHLELYGEDGVLIKSTKNKEWYVQVTENEVTISNNGGTAQIKWNGSAWEIKGPVVCDGLLTANAGLQLAGNIAAVGGGEYAGDFITTGTIKSGTIPLATHKHTGVTTGGGTSGGPTP